MRTKGFCSALLRCGEIKLIAGKREGPVRICQFVHSILRFFDDI